MEARLIRLRYDGVCLKCATALSLGGEAWWDPQRKTVTCHSCASGQPADPFAVPQISSSSPGASAQREYERRSTRREMQVRKDHPMLGGLILATTAEPNSTTAWSKGAQGERRLGARLDGLPNVVAMHDRRIPHSSANVDHLAVTASGVWVIDAKQYKGRIECRPTGFMGTGPYQLVCRREGPLQAHRRGTTPGRCGAASAWGLRGADQRRVVLHRRGMALAGAGLHRGWRGRALSQVALSDIGARGSRAQVRSCRSGWPPQREVPTGRPTSTRGGVLTTGSGRRPASP
jgi:hypothetical protein